MANLLIETSSAKVLAADLGAADYFGRSAADLEGMSVHDLIPALDSEKWNTIVHQNDNKICLFPVQLGPSAAASATQLTAQVRLSPMVGSSLNGVLLSIQCSAVASNTGSHVDALTGLPDRRELRHRFDLLKYSSLGDMFPVAVVFIDLDHFKRVNDELGHAVGDSVLVTLADRWKRCVRDDDLVVRYGGDEFVILLADVGCREAAEPILTRIAEATNQEIHVDNHAVRVGVTLGIAVAKSANDDLQQLVVAADQDMYAAKKAKA